MKILVLTVSDRAARGEYEDLSGPAVEKVLRNAFPAAAITRATVPDEIGEIRSAIEAASDRDLILTTGGTGLSPRDVTPEATAASCDRMVPGIADFLRTESLKQTPNAALSRATAGMRGKLLIVNLPGSVRGARFCAQLLAPLLPHALEMIEGGKHE